MQRFPHAAVYLTLFGRAFHCQDLSRQDLSRLGLSRLGLSRLGLFLLGLILQGLIASPVAAADLESFYDPATGKTIQMTGSRRHDVIDQVYLNRGAQSQYGSVGFMVTEDAFGSATYIGNGWIVTAAHAIENATGADSLVFLFNDNIYFGSQMIVHEQWNSDPLNGHDIGLVRLDSFVTGVEAARFYGGRNEVGKIATYVGYGFTGTGETGATDFDGLKRAGTNAIDGLGSDVSVTWSGDIMLSDFDSPDGLNNSLGPDLNSSATPTDNEFLMAQGDSGGAVFAEFGGEEYLIGVNSFVGAEDNAADSDYGDISGATRISNYSDWITLHTGIAAAVPEPSPFYGVLVIGAVWFFLFRRRSSTASESASANESLSL